jgi:hypothetical protein
MGLIKESPIFCAHFADGIKTRMTVWQAPERKALDLGRGVRLARHAYRSRTGEEPTAIVAAHYECEGETLQKYSAAELDISKEA